MKFKYDIKKDTVEADGKAAKPTPGIAMAIDTVAKRHGLTIQFLGWDSFFTHSVEIGQDLKSEVLAERQSICDRMSTGMAADQKSVCPKCGRHGTFTTARTICDDCA